MSRKLMKLLEIGALLLVICATRPDGAAGGFKPVQLAAEKGPLPVPGTYKIDPVHSFVYFSAWHHVVGRVQGRFDKVTGTIHVKPDLAACTLDIAIDTATIDTQNTERDEDLKSPAFFDSAKFPAMTYRGRGIRHISGNTWRIDGSLTIRGVTQVVPLTFTFNGSFPDSPPAKPARVAFQGTAATKRGDFGMTRDNLLELGLSPAGPDVEIQIAVEADAESPTP